MLQCPRLTPCPKGLHVPEGPRRAGPENQDRHSAAPQSLALAELLDKFLLLKKVKSGTALAYKKIVGSFIADALGSLHKPTAQALEKVETAQQDSEKKKKKADKYAKESKEWADKRVADVSNQMILVKNKNKELEKELGQKEKNLEDQAALLQWYQKKFGNLSDKLPKM